MSDSKHANASTIRTRERALELRAKAPGTLLHGARQRAGLVVGATRRCHPGRCLVRDQCPHADQPEDKRTGTCEPLAAHLARIGSWLRRGKPSSATRELEVVNILRREGLLCQLDWYFAVLGPFESKDGRVVPRPALEAYRRLLGAQDAALRALDLDPADRPSPALAWARALDAVAQEDCGAGEGGDE